MIVFLRRAQAIGVREDSQSYARDVNQHALATQELSSTAPVPTDNAGWVALANANIAAGRGQVWPVFKKFYGR